MDGWINTEEWKQHERGRIREQEVRDQLALFEKIITEKEEMLRKGINYLKESKLSKVEPKEEKKSESLIPKHVDSGVQTTSGTGRIWKATEIQRMTIDERFQHRKEIANATKEGRIRMNE